MLVICTATTPAGRVTHHLVRADSGPDAYRRVYPLLTSGSNLVTRSLEHWIETRGSLPCDLQALDLVSAGERQTIDEAGGLIHEREAPALREPSRHPAALKRLLARLRCICKTS